MSDALLLDEPYAGLRRSLTELVDTREVPAVLAAHELAEAQAFADKLERGAELTGMVTGCGRSGAGREADLAIGTTAVAGPDAPSVPRGPSNPEQVGR